MSSLAPRYKLFACTSRTDADTRTALATWRWVWARALSFTLANTCWNLYSLLYDDAPMRPGRKHIRARTHTHMNSLQHVCARDRCAYERVCVCFLRVLVRRQRNEWRWRRSLCGCISVATMAATGVHLVRQVCGRHSNVETLEARVFASQRWSGI